MTKKGDRKSVRVTKLTDPNKTTTFSRKSL